MAAPAGRTIFLLRPASVIAGSKKQTNRPGLTGKLPQSPLFLAGLSYFCNGGGQCAVKKPE
jgi:hypothetical protein